MAAIGLSSKAEYGPRWAKKNSPHLEDDFYNYTSGGIWTTLAASSGSTAQSSTGGTSNLLCTTAASTSDYQGTASTNASWLIQSQQPLGVHCRFRYTNQSSNNGVIVFGFWSATPVTAATGVPAVSGSHTIIYKLNGDTFWRVQSSNGTAKKDCAKTTVGCQDGTYELEIGITGGDAADAAVYYYVNGQQLFDNSVSPNTPIIHKIAYSGLAAMKTGFYAMAGSANVQTAFLDIHTTEQGRLT